MPLSRGQPGITRGPLSSSNSLGEVQGEPRRAVTPKEEREGKRGREEGTGDSWLLRPKGFGEAGRGLGLPPPTHPQVGVGGVGPGPEVGHFGLPHGPRGLHRESGREHPLPSHLLLASHTRPAAPAPGAASRVRPWRPSGRAVEPRCSQVATSRQGTGTWDSPARTRRRSRPCPAPSALRGGAAQAWCCLRGAPVGGVSLHRSLPPFPCVLGYTWDTLCPKLCCEEARARMRAPRWPATWHPLAAVPPTSKRLSGHHCQTAPITAWPLVLKASGCFRPWTLLGHLLPPYPQDIRWGPSFPSHSPES